MMIEIGTYQESDFSALTTIFLRAIKETACRDYTPRQIAAWAQVDDERWRARLAASRVLVATVNARPVGFITAREHYIDLLFVDPDFIRRGIASALLTALFSQIPQGTLSADVSLTARACFEKHGFQVIEEQHVEARGERFTNFRMEKYRPG